MTESPATVIVAHVAGGSAGAIDAFRREADEVGGTLLVVEGEGRLVPELWRDALLRATTPIVAFSTSAMVPRPGWLRSLLRSIDSPHLIAVGGAIVPRAGLAPLDGAIYLARYLNYLEPRDGTQPAGENAVYRRDALLDISHVWAEGFWEAEVHAYLSADSGRPEANRALVRRFDLDRSAILEYSGSATLRETIGRRFRHGWRYGSTRPRGRLGPLQALACPAILPLLGWRIWGLLRQVGVPAGFGVKSFLPWLAITAAWSLGEGAGLAFRNRRVPSPRRRSCPSPTPG